MGKAQDLDKPGTRVPTLDDVAGRAGVSAATVSRFLSNPAIVAQGTGTRIERAIRETGYIPNALAGGLASSRSRLVAVLIPNLVDSIFNVTIETMVEELAASGLNVMLGLTGMSQERTCDLIRAAISRRADAIISTGPMDDATAEMVTRSGCLFIQMWELPADPIGLAIGFSHHDAGRDIARFLHARGYRRPHIVTAEGPRAQQRRNGLVEEWSVLGGETPSEAAVGTPPRFGHARGIFADLLALPQRPDVVVCGSDNLAQGVIVEAQSAGMTVPGEIAVLGFGNSAIAGEMRPTITSVDIDGSRIAREALAAIKRHADTGQRDAAIIDVGFRLIVRESA
ncbi:LacI family DNA-binding transcriptional regulator [Tsuneonella sp. HG222]